MCCRGKKIGRKKGRAQPQAISPLHHLNPNSKAPSYDAFSSLVPDHFCFVAKVWDFPSLCPLINPADGLALQRYKTTSQELSAHDQHSFPNKPQTSRCLSSETVSLPRYSITRRIHRAAVPYPATDGEAHVKRSLGVIFRHRFAINAFPTCDCRASLRFPRTLKYMLIILLFSSWQTHLWI